MLFNCWRQTSSRLFSQLCGLSKAAAAVSNPSESVVTVDSGLEIVKGCEDHCRRLASLEATALGEPSLAEIAVYSAQMKSHRREIRRVIEQSKGTSNLVCFL